MSKVVIPESVRFKLKGMVSRGIMAVELDERGHLIFTLTDGSTVDLGVVSTGGSPGIYVGKEEPTDNSVLLWITVEDDSGDDTGGEDDTEENTPAILGVAVLGRTILGDYNGASEKLDAPEIELVEV